MLFRVILQKYLFSVRKKAILGSFSALSRRDDLISLAYTLIYFLKGELPWFKYKTHSKEQYTELAGHLKNRLTVEELCSDCPGK